MNSWYSHQILICILNFCFAPDGIISLALINYSCFFFLCFYIFSWNKRVCKINPDNRNNIYITMNVKQINAIRQQEIVLWICGPKFTVYIVWWESLVILYNITQKQRGWEMMFILIKINGTWNKCITINVYIILTRKADQI